MWNLENQILIFESYLIINCKKNANDNINKKKSLVATTLAAILATITESNYSMEHYFIACLKVS